MIIDLNNLPYLFQDGYISFDEFTKILEKTNVEQKMSIKFLS